MDGRGFNAADWPLAATFKGRCAAPHDVDAGAAVFALGDTFNGRPLVMDLPQPVIWYEDDEEFAALVVQAANVVPRPSAWAPLRAWPGPAILAVAVLPAEAAPWACPCRTTRRSCTTANSSGSAGRRRRRTL